MSKQPEALRLAQELDAYHTRSCHKEAAAELRRLHAENEALQNTKHYEAPRGFVLNPDYLVPELRAQRDALLEALRPFAAINASIGFTYKDVDRARAAIKQAEGEKA